VRGNPSLAKEQTFHVPLVIPDRARYYLAMAFGTPPHQSQAGQSQDPGRSDLPERSPAFDRISLLIWWAILGYAIVLVFGVGFRFVINGLLDDSFYYMQVARNVAEGLGSTFDGVEPTNGYHPLWMWLLVPIHWIWQDSETCTRMGLALGTGIGSIALWNLRTILREQVGSWAAAIGLTLFLWPRFFGQYLNLLETALLLLCYLAIVRLWVSAEPFGRGSLLRFAMLLGLASLARLDTVFLLLTIGGSGALTWILRRPFWPGRTRATSVTDLLPFGLTALCVLPYLFWNWKTFGHLQPISGAMKSAFPEPLLRLEHLTQFPEFVAIQVLALGFIVGGLRRGASPFLRILGLFSIASVLHTTYTVLFMRWAVDRWHFGLLLVVGLLGLPYLAERCRRWIGKRPIDWSKAIGLVILLGIVVWAQSYSLRLRAHRFQADVRDLSEWIEQNTPEDAIFATTDSGILAYFSGRETINLDGLINNYRYRDFVREGRVLDYLNERKVGYILDQYMVGMKDVIEGNYESRPYRLWYRPEDRVSSEITLFRLDEVRRVPVDVRFSLGSAATAPNAIVLWKYRSDRQTR